jgi:hypothetical protein
MNEPKSAEDAAMELARAHWVDGFEKAKAIAREREALLVEALEFYASQDQWSCRLRSKYEGDRLKWYDEAENYFQDPYDLKAMHDMGKAATEALEQIKQMKAGLNE